jgi:hemerythrin-like metal-binding protein
MTAYWGSFYETGVQEIDLQHQEILARLNAVSSSSSAKQSRDMLIGLLAYLHQHFRLEEQFMPPDAEASKAHQQEHKRLADIVGDLRDRVLTLQIPRIEQECNDLIRDLLVEHTWRFDRPMAVSSLQARNAMAEASL